LRFVSDVVERLRSLLSRDRENRELDEEIRFHIDSEAERLRMSGMDAREARRVAYIRFGGVERMRERTREARGTAWVERTLADIRIAHRALMRTPGQSLAAIVTLALGIGVATTEFGTIYGAFYRALPFEDPESFVVVETITEQNLEGGPVAYHDFLDWRGASGSFRDLGGVHTGTMGLRDSGGGLPLSTAFVTWDVFEIVGTRPEIGRTFGPEDDVPGAPLAVVLSHRVWEERFASEESVVGMGVVVNGEPATVVGVMPDGFHFPESQDLWVPMRLDAGAVERGAGPSLLVYGHLAEGVPIETASAEIGELARRSAADHPETNRDVGARAILFRDRAATNEALIVNWMLMLTALGVLLIACVNVANLLLGRAAVRMRELALRSALGASRRQIMLHMLAESVCLSAYGGLLGAGIGWLGVAGIRYGMQNTDTPYWIRFEMNPTVFVFAAASAVAAGIVAGLLPAIRATMGDFMTFLKDGSRGSTGLRIGRVSRVLVGVEVAFAVCLLFVSGVMIKSALTLTRFERPFTEAGVVVANVDLFDEEDSTRREDLLAELPERARELAGVAHAALTTIVPGLFTPRFAVEVEGEAYRTEEDVPLGRVAAVSPDYFDVLEAPLVAGRAFGDQDDTSSLPVAIVNQGLARERFGDADPIGRRIRVGGATADWRTVVGVAPDLLMQGLANVGLAEGSGLYIPARQFAGGARTLLVRSEPGSQAVVMDGIREAARSLDPDLATYDVRTLADAIGRSTWYFSLTSAVFVVFGVVALFLACVGLLGVVAFESERRTQEVGVRMALGARAGDVVRLIVGQGIGQMLVGTAFGVLMATGLARVLTVVLFETDPNEPLIYVLTIGTIFVVGALASLYPALRAARTDPVTSLQGG